jgi:hypothetical protein
MTTKDRDQKLLMAFKIWDEEDFFACADEYDTKRGKLSMEKAIVEFLQTQQYQTIEPISNEQFNAELERRMPKDALGYDLLMKVLTKPASHESTLPYCPCPQW